MTQPKLTFDQAMQRLHAKANPKLVAGSMHFGLKTPNIMGVPLPEIRAIAKGQRDHDLAQQLWQTGIHEARLLASMVEDPHQVTEAQMDAWVKDFDNWGVCDGVCNDVFKRTPFAFPKAIEWCQREEEFVRRAGFVMMAVLAIHAKQIPQEEFLKFLPYIKRYAVDERNFVKKAVNWALRQIGKRNPFLREKTIEAAEEIQGMDSPSAHWIAKDALRELKS